MDAEPIETTESNYETKEEPSATLKLITSPRTDNIIIESETDPPLEMSLCDSSCGI